ncbi:MAG TPA: copper chaperone PCu(A)C [Woeseiaceae bacterium]|nr:copper chaperone PCu(A)C [Woeseiaceae bacterium]
MTSTNARVTHRSGFQPRSASICVRHGACADLFAISCTMALLFVMLIASGCDDTSFEPLQVSDIVINAPLPGTRMSAGYLTLTNNSDESLRISTFDSPQFKSIELHETITAGGVSRMRPVPELDVPPHSSVQLAPGGKHLMLMGPVAPLDVVTLNIYSGNGLLVSISTEAVAY